MLTQTLLEDTAANCSNAHEGNAWLYIHAGNWNKSRAFQGLAWFRVSCIPLQREGDALVLESRRATGYTNSSPQRTTQETQFMTWKCTVHAGSQKLQHWALHCE